jgi:ABC-type nitrate/sulfonate/bicarbonate transport system permease component
MNIRKIRLGPNSKTSDVQSSVTIWLWVVLTFLVWDLSNSVLFPRPKEIGEALLDLLLYRNIIADFFVSIGLCLKAMGVAILVSMLLGYLSVFPIMKPLSNFCTRLRFLPTIGLTFLFMKLSGDVGQQKTMILVYGITVFFVTSIMSIVSCIPEDEYNYARTLGFNEYRITWEVVILGRLADVFDSIRQNFAISWIMLAMVEKMAKS